MFEMVTGIRIIHSYIVTLSLKSTKILLLSCRRMHAIKLPIYYVGEKSNEYVTYKVTINIVT